MKRLTSRMDKWLLAITLIFIIFGSLMILNASSVKSIMIYGVYYKYFIKQVIIIAIGLIASIFVLILPLKIYKKSFMYAVLIGLYATLIILIVSGTITNNMKGWFYLFGFGIQPSEFAKLILIVYIAVYFDRVIKTTGSETKIPRIFFPFALAAAVIILVFAQPDTGTALIISAIIGIIFIILPIEKKIKLGTLFSLSGALFILSLTFLFSGQPFFKSYQKDRITGFISPCKYYKENKGYQVCNGFIAINTGGITGVGIGKSSQKYLYLPEAHTDFIFPIIVEELGLVTGFIILVLYFMLVFRIIIIGNKSHQLQGYIICYGVAFYIFIHILVNLGGVLALIPLTGVPLPFLSYGGSYTLTLIIAIALVQRVNIENEFFSEKIKLR